MAKTKKQFSCSDCKVMGCRSRDSNYPNFCITTALDEEKLQDTVDIYKNNENIRSIMLTAAEVEGLFYGQKTRVEETVEFIKRFGAKKVGIASCVGMLNESNLLSKIFDKNGIQYYTAGCKIGAVDKGEVGIPDENKINRGCGHESMCNPILQAEIFNEEGTDINIIMGLCVGHDMLFAMYSKAPVTTLVVKDRVMAHNPIGALYTSTGMYSRFK